MYQFVDYHVDKALDAQSRKYWSTSKTEHEHSKPEEPRSLLGTLIEQTRDKEILRDQIIQALMALQNKTSILVSNTIFLLSRNPDIWQQLRQDTSQLNLSTYTAKELREVRLLQNIFKEVLRLYPVFGQLGRTAMQNTLLPSGGGRDGSANIYIRAGSRTLSSFFGLHRDASVFGDDVETFDPDRWNRINLGPWEYMPFGNGPRSCAGKDKALAEASYVVLAITKRFPRIESRDDRDWVGEWKLTVKNLHGCKIALFTE